METDLISRYEELLLRGRTALEPECLAGGRAYEALLRRARPLIIQPLIARQEDLRRVLVLLQPWYTTSDLLTIAGLDDDENAYTRLLAQALAPPDEPDLALRIQRTWLQELGLPLSLNLTQPALPPTFALGVPDHRLYVQLYTHDGIPDLVLQFGRLAVVVEAKTVTDEHATPSGRMQTEAYPDSVRSRLGVRDVTVVYLSRDGRPAANPDAIVTTFAHCAVALASALQDVSLSAPLQSVYIQLITHFLTAGEPQNSWSEVFTPGFLRDEPWESDTFPMSQFRTIYRLSRLLL